jgi:hypothetical protein
MTAQEFYRKRLVELSPDGIMNKINQVVDITTQVQICEEYHQYKLGLLITGNVMVCQFDTGSECKYNGECPYLCTDLPKCSQQIEL